MFAHCYFLKKSERKKNGFLFTFKQKGRWTVIRPITVPSDNSEIERLFLSEI